MFKPRFKHFAPLAGLALGVAVVATAAGGADADSGWNLSATCVDYEGVYGTVSFPAGTGSFTLSLQDHVPGDGHFKDVANSGWNVVPGPQDTSAQFGPLYNAYVRTDANSIRVVNSASNEKSPSIPPCAAPIPD
jgi:hypothetical protein